jgi:putative flavoprotein involved in K+ transport
VTLMSTARTERTHTLVIGGGQAGLATGYHLARRGLDFRILDASRRIGDAWRHRWDSLRLFTPARFNSLPGMRFPAPPHTFPTKDEFADYLERYAGHFDLAVRCGARVQSLRQREGRFVAMAGECRFEADNVVVAMANYQKPWRPAFAADLDERIVQVHSADYRGPGQLRPGPVLIIGAGNSGAEIARELAGRHPVWMSGRDVGQLPFRLEGLSGRLLLPLVLRAIFYRVLSVDTSIGRKARPAITSRGGPLIRVRRRHLEGAGVRFVGRTVGSRDGRPVLDSGEVLDVANVVWCTGFRPGFEDWIHLPVHDPADDHEPRHCRGIATDVPGLFFVGLNFQRALSSVMIHGVGRDAAEIVRTIAASGQGAAAGITAGRHVPAGARPRPSLSR